MVQLGRARALVLGADPAVVPLVDDAHPVGVECGDEDRDGVVEDLVDLVVVARGEEMDDLRGRLARRDLGGVKRVGLDENDLAVGDRGVDLVPGVPSRVLQDRVHALVVVEPGEVFRGRDEKGQEGLAQRGRAHVHDLDAIALLADEFIVLDELVPVRQLPVRAHLVAEKFLRGGDVGGLGGLLCRGFGRQGEEEGEREQGNSRQENPLGHRTGPCFVGLGKRVVRCHQVALSWWAGGRTDSAYKGRSM